MTLHIIKQQYCKFLDEDHCKKCVEFKINLLYLIAMANCWLSQKTISVNYCMQFMVNFDHSLTLHT